MSNLKAILTVARPSEARRLDQLVRQSLATACRLKPYQLTGLRTAPRVLARRRPTGSESDLPSCNLGLIDQRTVPAADSVGRLARSLEKLLYDRWFAGGERPPGVLRRVPDAAVVHYSGE
jgi:hypothetical protein